MPLRMGCVLLLLVVCGGLAGCGFNAAANNGGVLNRLDALPDTDGDAFSEIQPPEGVELDPEQMLSLSVINTITRSEAEAASGVQVSSFISSSVEVVGKVNVELTYANGVTQTLPGTFPLGPVNLQFEFACPEQIEVTVDIVAMVPIIGEQPVSTFGPYVFTKDEGLYVYSCGAVITIETFIDEITGQPMVDLNID